MAIGAIAQCLQRYGDETLITALQCVTQTVNNIPGVLTGRTIKALCQVLHKDRARRDSGLALLEAFDSIDLAELQSRSGVDAAVRRIGRVQAMADRIRGELDRLVPRESDVASISPAVVIRQQRAGV
jgi:hypothetical protein